MSMPEAAYDINDEFSADAFMRRMELQDPRDSWRHADVPPPVTGPEDYGLSDGEPEIAVPVAESLQLPPLTIDDWRGRDLPEPDWLLGHWLSTTSRVQISAPIRSHETGRAPYGAPTPVPRRAG